MRHFQGYLAELATRVPLRLKSSELLAQEFKVFIYSYFLFTEMIRNNGLPNMKASGNNY